MDKDEAKKLWEAVNNLDDFTISRILACVTGTYLSKLDSEKERDNSVAKEFFEELQKHYDYITSK